MLFYFTLSTPKAEHQQALHHPKMLAVYSTLADCLTAQITFFVVALPSWETRSLPHDERRSHFRCQIRKARNTI